MLIEGMVWLFVLWIFSDLVTGLLISSELETILGTKGWTKFKLEV